MKTKASIILFLAFSMVLQTYGQELESENYIIEIQEVLQKKSIMVLGTVIFPKSKKKFVGLKVSFIPKSNEKKDFDLSELTTKYKNEEFPFLLPNAHGMAFEGTGNFFSSKRKKIKTIYAQVPKYFSEGDIFYKGEKIAEIKFKADSKKGTIKMQRSK